MMLYAPTRGRQCINRRNIAAKWGGMKCSGANEQQRLSQPASSDTHIVEAQHDLEKWD